jgi:hypothetical protein
MWILIQGGLGSGHRLLHLESGASITAHPTRDGRFVLTYANAFGKMEVSTLGSDGGHSIQIADFDTAEQAEEELKRLAKDLSARSVPTETRFSRGA